MSTTQASGLVSNAQRLRNAYSAIRIAFSFFAMTKKVDQYVTENFCNTMSADPKLVRISKKLMSSKIPEYQVLTNLRSEIKRVVWGMTLPYPEDKVRLVPNDKLGALEDQLTELKARWDAAVPAFNAVYQRMLENEEFRADLGELWNRADYPSSIEDRFSFVRDMVNVEPPAYLMQLNPRLYEEQAALVKARFEQAAQMAIDELLGKFQEMVAGLATALSGGEDGKQKKFNNTTVTKITEFVNNFRTLNINADPEFNALMERAESVVRGVEPQELRSFDNLRTQTREAMEGISKQLEQMMEVRGRRSIIRETPVAEPPAA